jgi:hypothetical protein
MATQRGQTMEQAYGKAYDSSWQPVATSALEKAATQVDKGAQKIATRESTRETKGRPAERTNMGGRRGKKSRKGRKASRKSRKVTRRR